MKKSWISVSLALFLAVIGAASFTRCGSDGFGVSGVIDASDLSTDIDDILGDMINECSGSTCDGSFDNDEAVSFAGKAISFNSDTSALLYILYDAFYAVDAYDLYYYGPDLVNDDGGDDFYDQFNEDDLVPSSGEDPDNFLPISITASATIPCGANAADGTIHVSDTLVSALNENEDIVEGFDYEAGTTAVSFNNCLIEGDFLTPPGATGIADTDEQSLRLNGTAVYTWSDNENDPEDENDDVYRERFTGTVNITERDNDTGTAGLQDFWTSPLVLNMAYTGDEVAGEEGPNGGFCIGAGVNLGVEEADDPYDDEDDGCNEDSDEGDETFFSYSDFWNWWYD